MVRADGTSGLSWYNSIDRDTGKQWHPQKSAFRPTSGKTSYEKRIAGLKAMTAMKAKEKGMKDEKEGERQVLQDVSLCMCRYIAEGKLSEAHASDQRKKSHERREGAL